MDQLTARSPDETPASSETQKPPVLAHLRLLLWLKLKLAMRQYSGSKGRLVGLIVVLFTVAPMSLILAMGVYYSLRDSSPPLVAESVHLLYFGIFLFWVTSPVIGFRANEFFDATKIFAFPVSHRTVFVATLFGSLTNGMLLFFLPTLLMATLTLEGGSGAVACRLVLLLPALVLLSQAAIQCLTLVLLNLLRSRRFRDLTAVLAALFGASVYLGFRLLAERRGVSQLPQLLGLGLSKYLAFSPSFWISSAAVRLPDGGVMAALSGLGPTLALTLTFVWLGIFLERKAFFGEIPFAQSPKREAARARRDSQRRSTRLLRDDVSAIFEKELRVLRREPAVKTQLISQTSYLVIPVVLSILSSRSGRPMASTSVPFVFAGFLGALALAESFLFLNLLGLEGPGINLLLSSPMPRRRILLGKDLAYLSVFGTVNTVILLALSVLLKVVLGRPWEVAVADFLFFAFLGITLLVILVSLGNFLSVFLPLRTLARGRRAVNQQNVEGEGCGKAFLRALALLGVVIYLAPVVLVLLLPRFHASPVGAWFYAVAVPFAILYAGATWVVSLNVAEGAFAKRESQLLAFYTSSPQ